MNNILYISADELLHIHDKILSISGGRAGVKSLGQIESITEHIQNDLYYPSLEEKLTHLIFAIAKFHAFVDGNKRTSIAAAAEFLNKNDFSYLVNQFIVDMEVVVVMVVENTISKEFLLDIVTCILEYGSISQEIKWKIITLK